MAKTVMTVNGPITPEKIGKTAIHEHLILAFPGWRYDPDSTFDEDKAQKYLVEVLTKAKSYGLSTVVDAWPYADDRFPELYRKVQQETGVNIIKSAGIQHAGAGNSYWSNLLWSHHPLEEMRPRLVHAMLKDIEEGIEGTDVKAGIIKCSTEKGTELSLYEQLSFSAAGIVQKQTGVPVITHTTGATLAHEQVDMLTKFGADPKKIAIGHLCDTNDVDYIESVLKKGVYVNFDRLGNSIDLVYNGNDHIKMACIVELINRGYVKQLMLGHDSVTMCTGLPFYGFNLNREADWGMDLSHWHVYGMLEYHIPELMKMGVTEEQIEDMLVNNPRRYLCE